MPQWSSPLFSSRNGGVWKSAPGSSGCSRIVYCLLFIVLLAPLSRPAMRFVGLLWLPLLAHVDAQQFKVSSGKLDACFFYSKTHGFCCSCSSFPRSLISSLEIFHSEFGSLWIIGIEATASSKSKCSEYSASTAIRAECYGRFQTIVPNCLCLPLVCSYVVQSSFSCGSSQS